MARQYFAEDCTVFTIDSDSALAYIGSGSIKGTETVAENNALADAYDNEKVLRRGVEVTLELASDTDCAVDIWALWVAGAAVPLVITTDKVTVTGNFTVKSPGLDFADAIRESVTLKNDGTVTFA
jgi:hypothetical protein